MYRVCFRCGSWFFNIQKSWPIPKTNEQNLHSSPGTSMEVEYCSSYFEWFLCSISDITGHTNILVTSHVSQPHVKQNHAPAVSFFKSIHINIESESEISPPWRALSKSYIFRNQKYCFCVGRRPKLHFQKTSMRGPANLCALTRKWPWEWG